jgi:hypothetical protein
MLSVIAMKRDPVAHQIHHASFLFHALCILATACGDVHKIEARLQADEYIWWGRLQGAIAALNGHMNGGCKISMRIRQMRADMTDD